MKICEKCNLSYDDDKKFCKECGDPLILKHQASNSIKNNIGILLIIVGVVLFAGFGYKTFQVYFQPESIFNKSVIHLNTYLGYPMEVAAKMSAKSLNTMKILFPALVIIGGCVSFGGYVLFKSGKKNY